MRSTTIIGPNLVVPPAMHHGDGVVVHVDNRVPVAHLFRQVKEVRLVYEPANLRYVDRRDSTSLLPRAEVPFAERGLDPPSVHI